MLTLTIENFDSLADGGPLSHEVNRNGFDFGRDQYLDWTLPDESRFISGKHCEVRYFDNGYWLYDISTNGTFVNNSSRRVQSPYKLANGDKLEIGDYIVMVSLQGEGANQAAPATTNEAPEQLSGTGIWQSSDQAPPPIDRRDLMAPAEQHSRAADFMNQVAIVPDAGLPPQESTNPPGQGGDPWGVTGIETPQNSSAPPPVQPVHAAAPNPAHQNQPPPQPGNQHSESFDETIGSAKPPPVPAPAAPAPPAPPAASPQQHQRQQVPANHDAGMEFIRQFAAGANIPPESLSSRQADELANELGQIMRIVSAQLMQLLSARAAAKSMARSGQRTMIEKTENNPLKFMPSPEEAIRTMMTNQTASYLDARQSMEQSFSDLQKHQVATYSAMQHAIRELMDDLSPEKIKKSVGKGKKSLLGGKGKLWEAYEEHWAERTEGYDNGMLDAFLVLFSEYYEKNV